MALRVYCLCTYRTSPNSWSQGAPESHWVALKFVHAIKGKTIRGDATLTAPGVASERICAARAHLAPEWFGRWAAAVLQTRSLLSDRLVLIPIPDKACTLTSGTTPRTLALAEALARSIGHLASVEDLLRWKTQLRPARLGGTRDPALLFPHLQVMKRLSSPSLVLVDDVMTSGGHLQATAARLEQAGGKVNFAVCAAKADQHFTRGNALRTSVHNLDDYVWI